MSVLDSVKQAVGLTEQPPQYECEECGHVFRTTADPDSYWYNCPSCDAEAINQKDEPTA